MRIYQEQKGQAMVELAIFGSIVLIVFGALLSYLQQLNDQQYVQMESFRRALYVANTGGATAKDMLPSGSVAQVTLMQNRRHVDLSGNFMKRSSQNLSSSANVFWAVPEAGAESKQRVYVKVNEDYSSDLSEEEPIENINTASEASFSEEISRNESPQAITNTRSSVLKDSVTTTLVDKDGKTIWEVKQGVFRDSDGQYKYSEDAVGTEVERTKTWETAF